MTKRNILFCCLKTIFIVSLVETKCPPKNVNSKSVSVPNNVSNAHAQNNTNSKTGMGQLSMPENGIIGVDFSRLNATNSNIVSNQRFVLPLLTNNTNASNGSIANLGNNSQQQSVQTISLKPGRGGNNIISRPDNTVSNQQSLPNLRSNPPAYTSQHHHFPHHNQHHQWNVNNTPQQVQHHFPHQQHHFPHHNQHHQWNVNNTLAANNHRLKEIVSVQPNNADNSNKDNGLVSADNKNHTHAETVGTENHDDSNRSIVKADFFFELVEQELSIMHSNRTDKQKEIIRAIAQKHEQFRVLNNQEYLTSDLAGNPDLAKSIKNYSGKIEYVRHLNITILDLTQLWCVLASVYSTAISNYINPIIESCIKDALYLRHKQLLIEHVENKNKEEPYLTVDRLLNTLCGNLISMSRCHGKEFKSINDMLNENI